MPVAANEHGLADGCPQWVGLPSLPLSLLGRRGNLTSLATSRATLANRSAKMRCCRNVPSERRQTARARQMVHKSCGRDATNPNKPLNGTLMDRDADPKIQLGWMGLAIGVRHRRPQPGALNVVWPPQPKLHPRRSSG